MIRQYSGSVSKWLKKVKNRQVEAAEARSSYRKILLFFLPAGPEGKNYYDLSHPGGVEVNSNEVNSSCLELLVQNYPE